MWPAGSTTFLTGTLTKSGESTDSGTRLINLRQYLIEGQSISVNTG